MSQQQWDSRYSAEEYIYGIEPNEYLRHFLDSRKPGRILFPAEGEGRNAVYAASLGWQVDAFDQSETGRQKALKLAAMKGVSINYGLISLEDWQPDSNIYDAVALVLLGGKTASPLAFACHLSRRSRFCGHHKKDARLGALPALRPASSSLRPLNIICQNKHLPRQHPD